MTGVQTCALPICGATALIYYAALFYAMDGSDAHGEHGGIHEAFIGAGLCGGPAVSALSLYLMPLQPTGPAWVVSGILGCGLVGVIGIWRRGTRSRSDDSGISKSPS